MLDQKFFLGMDGIIVLSFFLLLFSVVLLFIKKVVFNKKDYMKIAIGCAILTSVSLLLNNEEFSGTGIVHSYGWPHTFYSVWNSFDKTVNQNSFNPLYLFSNIIFYLILLLFFFVIFKKGAKVK